jgi:hypothetical protein
MAFELRDNTGSLFKQPPEKMTSENSPPYEGDFKFVCPHCHAESRAWIKAWVKEGKLGKFFSVAVKFRQALQQREQAPPAPRPAPPTSKKNPIEDEIPF